MNTHIRKCPDNLWSEEQETFERRRKYLWNWKKVPLSSVPTSSYTTNPDVDEVNTLPEIQD